MEPITKYFNAEKYESLIFIMIGIIAISFATYFFIKVKQPFYTGMAYPLLAIALIQIVVGGTVYLRSPKDIVRVNEIVQTNKINVQKEEIPRMKTVMKNFTIYRWVEIVLILAGISMFFFFQQMSIGKGIGLGLAIQAGIMLLLDYFAETRGKTYLDYLMTII